jgi:NitT/TauT family transport system substrate-binding protein
MWSAACALCRSGRGGGVRQPIASRRAGVRTSSIALLMFVAAIATAGVGAAGQDKPPHRVVVTTAGAKLAFFPAYVAEAADLFASENLDVETVDVGNGSRQVASLLEGGATMTMLDLQTAVAASQRGADLVAFAALFNKCPVQVVLHPEVMKRIGFRPNLSIDEKVKRLAGLTIGVTKAGSAGDSVLRALLLARGLDPNTALRIEALGSVPQLMAALEKRVVDGVMLSAPQAQIAQAGGSGQTAIDPMTGEVPELNAVPFAAMVTTRDTIQRYPAVITKTTRALSKAMLLADNNPDQAQQMLQRKVFPDIDPKLFAGLAPAYQQAAAKTPVIAREDYERLLQWMKILEASPVAVPYERMINTDFAKKAAAELLTR